MTVSPYQVANRILLLGIALIWMIAQTSQTLAHDSDQSRRLPKSGR
jgi:hypothetical protein